MAREARATPYADAVASRASEKALAWWKRTWQQLEPPLDRARFAAAYAGAGRRLGQAPLSFSASELESMAQAQLRATTHWALDDLGRAALILRAVECIEPATYEDLIADLFLRGDNRERHAVLQTLCMLPDPVRYLETAVESCRTNVVTVFEAIACENPYPAAFFPEPNFNQMVLKAIFLEVSVKRIEGMDQRMTSELVRMAEGYGSERRAAGRSVPDDIAYIVSKGPA
jgi:hypothetical protein